MSVVYDGLTRNAWTGTWSPSGDHPITLSNENRGGVHFITGNASDQLTDIPGQRLQEGMLVYVKNTYGSITGEKWYTYNLLVGESRSAITGSVPNASGNWSEFEVGSGASTISSLTDVSTNTPSTGNVLKWDGSQWSPAADSTSGGGGSDADTLDGFDSAYFLDFGNFTNTPTTLAGYGITDGYIDTDVDSHLNTSSATNSQVLSWNGTDYTWVAQSGGVALTDISVGSDDSASGTGGIDYDDTTGVFTYTPPDLSSYLTSVPAQAFSSLTGTPTTLAGYGITDAFDGAYGSLTGAPTIPSAITDLGITDGTSGQVLTTDGSGVFTFTTVSGGGGGGIALSDVDTHLNVSSAANNQVLSWNGTDYAWVAQPTVKTDLGSLTNVSNSTPSAGQVLKWSGTEWAPASDLSSSGSGGIDLSDISVTIAGAAGGGSLTYNNSTGVFLFTPADVSGFSTFSGSYADLTGKPTLFSGDYGDLTNIPASSDNMELSITGGTNLNLVNGTDNSIIDTVDLAGITSSLDYTQLDNLPSLFSGDYNDLTNTPSIPSLTGYATESFVQTYVLSTITTDNLLEGGTNLFFNNERVDDRVAVLIDAGTGLTKTYDDSGNLLTVDLADTAVTAGSYGSGTEIPTITVDQQGRITAAGTATVSSDLPIAGDTGTDTVSLLTDTLTFTGGVGVTTTVATDAVTIDIGQSVGTTDNVTFNDVTVSGDLEVLGTLTSLNTTNTELKDNTIVLNQGEVGAGVTLGSAGIEIDRGSEANVSLLFEEADDQWSTGAIRLVTGDLHAGEEIKSSITTSGGIVVNDRNLVLAGQTTDATTTEIFLNDGTSTIDIASGATAKFKATIVCTDGTDTAAFNITGLIQNVAGTTSLIGTNILETIAEDTGDNWSASITADDTSDYLKIEVTGEASTTIDWTVFMDISEVKR